MNIQKLLTVSSLEKVFLDQRPEEYTGKFSMLRKDQLSFQIAFCIDTLPEESSWRFISVKVDSPLEKWLDVSLVKNVPSQLPAANVRDPYYLRTTPGLYPDLLEPMTDKPVRVACNNWESLWFQLRTDETTPAGSFPVKITVTAQVPYGEKTIVKETEVTVEVIAAELPEQKLMHTEWFHSDCIADYYHVPVWSEEHWKLVEAQIRTMVKYGANMLLTPVFTPPLDTEVGGERTTVQLVDITRENGKYSFNFEKLDRWVRLAFDCGIKYLEIAHLYTQWGAYHCPKIMAVDNGEYRRIFGWESDAVSAEYRAFLEAFLPALLAELQRLGLTKDQFIFHISDEPRTEMLEQYHACREQVKDLLDGYTIMDALSDYEFYEKGVCEHPIVSTNHVTPYLENHAPNLWVYYCTSQGYQVSNRFMSMPSARNRIIGTQFYKYNVVGFLHWGYNFYNSQFSIRHIDPFAVTDADCAFQSGDSFLVYPGPDGTPWDSIRLRVFYDAINDCRAFELLESLTSREFVMNLLEGDLQSEITFFEYPNEASYLLNLRNRVNAEIKARI